MGIHYSFLWYNLELVRVRLEDGFDALACGKGRATEAVQH
jgi:hypothetical protein